ncbi:hypothetical protein H5410_056335 [Solanum commersonii]|uniref:Uncharacterized protein n=1 Tax=Solanum commersonii TaxID=4109 RepID=A0A9J5WJZ7_SOLCO|nr:hypothetical protein H5410_056335 [Solanum commersonii]
MASVAMDVDVVADTMLDIFLFLFPELHGPLHDINLLVVDFDETNEILAVYMFNFSDTLPI